MIKKQGPFSNSSPVEGGVPVGPACRVGLLLLGVIALSACDEDKEPIWKQFNAKDDQVTVEIGAEKATSAAAFTDLHSTSGEVLIGSASSDPGGGPVGTRHLIKVLVFDEYEGQVDKVTVRTDSGSRGIDEYRLKPDSADEGLWTLEMESVGSPGEIRSDLLTFRLWYDANDVDSAESE